MALNRIFIALAAGLVVLAGCSGEQTEVAAESTDAVAETTEPAAEPTETYSDTNHARVTPPATSDSATPSLTARTGKVLYLTFDDGPAVPETEQLLEILAEYDAKATFFVYGTMAKPLPEEVEKIVDAGQAIGNHTFSHPLLTTLSDQEIRQELRSTAKIVGPGMGPCMRPSYLDTNQRVRRISKQEGYATIMGDLAAQDWTNPPVSTLVKSLRGVTKDGNVIILHDGPTGRTSTVAAIRRMMPVWEKQGYSLEALPKCITTESVDAD